MAESWFSTPCPEFWVSQVERSAAIGKTAATDLLPRSTTLTCPSVPGSSVRKWVTYAFDPSVAMARACGHCSLTRALTSSPGVTTRSSLDP